MGEEARQEPVIHVDGKSPSEPAVGPIAGAQEEAVPRMEVVPRTAQKVTQTTHTLTKSRVQKSKLRRMSHVMLILSLFGVVGFIGGAALAASILLGAVDLEAGWIKDFLKVSKEALKHLRS